ncbi:MAG: alpha/beta fold hydrolase [Pseudomonadota bacterium]
MKALLTALTIALALPAWSQNALCGPEAPCTIDGGDYHLMAPDGWDGATPLPALVFFHGFRSSGASVFRSAGLKRTFGGQGFLVIAPNGAKRPGTDIRAWPARPDVGRDDVAFTLDVVEDVARQVPLARDSVYVTGFSAGGSMAWMMACYAGERFAGFASVAGALRRPNPAPVCPTGPVRMLQIHGFADAQVPLEGRGIRDWHQGDVFESLSLVRRTNECRSNPDAISIGDPFSCREWSSCAGGGVKMCLHTGGHGLPAGWTDLALDWFMGAATEQ